MERFKSTSVYNLIASGLSAAGDTSSAHADKAQRFTQEVSGLTDSRVLDVVRATHPYKCEFEDELAFDGDIIEVLEKQTEEAYWRGRIRGTTKVGLFPDNFVMSIRDSSPSNEQPADADSVRVVVTDGNALEKQAVPAPLATSVHQRPSESQAPVHHLARWKQKPPASTVAGAPYSM